LKALQVLSGVGDASAGEWWEVGEIATHLRRRLTSDEAAEIGPVCDVRGTTEGTRRFKAMRGYFPTGEALAFGYREAMDPPPSANADVTA